MVRAMEISDEGNSNANVAFWRRQFERFLYAATETEAVSALAEALRSDAVMPSIFRLVLADMLETGGVRGPDLSWTIKVIKRRDVKQTRGRLGVYAACKEVQELVDKGSLPTVACRQVATQRGKTQRSIEKAYQDYLKIMDMSVGEARRRAEAAMERSKALREGLANNDEPGP
jgi:hypothetical protein